MADSSRNFAKYCIRGLKPDKKRINQLLENSLMSVTALAPKIGYDNASRIAKNALKNGTTLKEEAIKSGLINKKEFNKLTDPKKMIGPR
jgi:fumarate hydratase class II